MRQIVIDRCRYLRLWERGRGLSFMFQRASWLLLCTSFVLTPVLSRAGAPSYNLELRELTGENPAARNVYLCECTLEQFIAVPLPGPNWEKNGGPDGGRLFLPDDATSTSPIPPAGTPETLDLIPEIQGPDHFFIARVLDAVPLGFGPTSGLMAIAHVARDTTMTFHAGSVIHTVTSTDDAEYILFSYDEVSAATWNPADLNGLAGLDVPDGWVYSSEVLTDDLTVVTPGGIAEVFTQGSISTYQKVILVPEPATVLVQLLSLAVIAGLRARARA